VSRVAQESTQFSPKKICLSAELNARPNLLEISFSLKVDHSIGASFLFFLRLRALGLVKVNFDAF